LLAFCSFGCGRGRTSGTAAAAPGLEGFGHFGESSGSGGGQTYRFRYPYLLENGRLAVAGFSHFGEKPMGPAFLVVTRLPTKDNVSQSFSSHSEDDRHRWSLQLSSGNDRAISIEHRADENAGQETIRLNNQEYDLTQGSVFAVDLVADPPSVTQAKADLPSLLPDASPTRDQFRAALTELRREHSPVESLYTE
jgi:hypothetical protein